MAIHVQAYAPTDPDREKRAQEEKLFCDNLPLLLEHAQDIVAVDQYFFCPLSFAWCAFLWIGGAGPLCLGHLLLGWSEGILTEPCFDCGGTILVTKFRGSPLSGSNWCTGFCIGCRSKKPEQGIDRPFGDRLSFGVSVRKQFPQEVSHWEEYDGFIFSWGGNGLQPARKKRLITEQVVAPVSFDVLIEELKSGNIRKGNPPQPVLVKTGYQFELRFKNGAVLTFPSR